MTLNQMCEDQKPRAKMKQQGSQSLSDCELLAILLQSGTPKKDVLELSEELLVSIGGIGNLTSVSFNSLCKINGIGEVKALKILVAVEISMRIDKAKHHATKINCVEDIVNLFQYLTYEKQENLAVVAVDTKGKIILNKIIYVGTINQIVIHPREILQLVIKELAYGFFIIHNHPSGNPEPSNADTKSTKNLITAANIVGISLIDHVIVAKDNYFSYKEEMASLFIQKEK